jgi:hypothetical protein
MDLGKMYVLRLGCKWNWLRIKSNGRLFILMVLDIWGLLCAVSKYQDWFSLFSINVATGSIPDHAE